MARQLRRIDTHEANPLAAASQRIAINGIAAGDNSFIAVCGLGLPVRELGGTDANRHSRKSCGKQYGIGLYGA